LNIPINTSALGVWNYTIYYNDSIGNFGMPDTVLIEVIDVEPPLIIHFANLTYLNCTTLEYHHTGLKITVHVVDNLLSHVFLCENSSGVFINRSIVNYIEDNYSIVLNIEDLNYDKNLAYYFYSNDSYNNWGLNDNSSNYYILKIYDFINPSACEINYSIYESEFVLKETLFTISGGTDFDGSGISHYEYNLDSGEWVVADTFLLTEISNGPHTISYRSVDIAGNNGIIQNFSVYLLASDMDYDNDYLTNYAEIYILGTSAINPDTDGDGLFDGAEVITHGTVPTKPDTDADGLSDGAEVITYGTVPTKPDTDADGLSDGAEVITHGTVPTNPDTDGDGVSDGKEIALGADPLDPNNPLIRRILLILEIVLGIILCGIIIVIHSKRKKIPSTSQDLINKEKFDFLIFSSIINALPSLNQIFVEKEKLKFPIKLRGLPFKELFTFFNTLIGCVPESEVRSQLNILMRRLKVIEKKESWTQVLIKLKALVELAESRGDRELFDKLMQLVILIKLMTKHSYYSKQ
ncbi:MAG: hypothetical protein HWN66_00655, partial [Candidatus Helarchaeota archaeon]|nr:hypothetical protein [Candidatus Helarchaeota archaeon]